MLSCYYNKLHNSVIQGWGRCVIIIHESPPCEEVTSLLLAKKTENRVGRRPESDTTCVPMRLNNGVSAVCPVSTSSGRGLPYRVHHKQEAAPKETASYSFNSSFLQTYFLITLPVKRVSVSLSVILMK